MKFGTETISYMGPQIWNLIPERLRTVITLTKFKKEIKNWKCDGSPYVECAKRTFNVLALLTKNYNVFFFRTLLL